MKNIPIGRIVLFGAVVLILLVVGIWSAISNLTRPAVEPPAPPPTSSSTTITATFQPTSSTTDSTQTPATSTPASTDTFTPATTDPGPSRTPDPTVVVGDRDYEVVLTENEAPADLAARLDFIESWMDLTIKRSTDSPYPGFDYTKVPQYVTKGAEIDWQSRILDYENPRPDDLTDWEYKGGKYAPWSQTYSIEQAFASKDGSTITVSYDFAMRDAANRLKVTQYVLEPCSKNPASLCVAYEVENPQSP